MVKYSFSQGGTVLTIYDSCAVPKSDFQKTLNQIKALRGEQPIFYRSDFSLKMEWAVHNFCHQVGFYKERTKDCDFDIPCNLPEWVYEAVGVHSCGCLSSNITAGHIRPTNAICAGVDILRSLYE